MAPNTVAIPRRVLMVGSMVSKLLPPTPPERLRALGRHQAEEGGRGGGSVGGNDLRLEGLVVHRRRADALLEEAAPLSPSSNNAQQLMDGAALLTNGGERAY